MKTTKADCSNSFRIMVDADACPVKDEIMAAAARFGCEVHMFADVNHRLAVPGALIHMVDQGADSVDLALANSLRAGDVVISQDYGVASLAIGKDCRVLHPSGMVIDGGNIDRLMLERHIAREERSKGRRSGKIKKRTAKGDKVFFQVLMGILDSL